MQNANSELQKTSETFTDKIVVIPIKRYEEVGNSC